MVMLGEKFMGRRILAKAQSRRASSAASSLMVVVVVVTTLFSFREACLTGGIFLVFLILLGNPPLLVSNGVVSGGDTIGQIFFDAIHRYDY